MSNVSVEEAGEGVTFGMKPGLTLGIYYKKNVLIGVGYSMRGSILEIDGLDDPFVYNLNYLDISVLYPYAVGSGNIFAGLNIGFNLSAKLTSDMSGFEEVDLTEDDAMNNLDYGITLGYKYPINEDMGIRVGYYIGLADWSGNNNYYTDPSHDQHRAILFNLEYAIF